MSHFNNLDTDTSKDTKCQLKIPASALILPCSRLLFALCFSGVMQHEAGSRALHHKGGCGSTEMLHTAMQILLLWSCMYTDCWEHSWLLLAEMCNKNHIYLRTPISVMTRSQLLRNFNHLKRFLFDKQTNRFCIYHRPKSCSIMSVKESQQLGQWIDRSDSLI